MLQVVIMNVGGLPLFSTPHKNIELGKFAKNHSMDVLERVEINAHWFHTPAEHELGEKTLMRWEFKHMVIANKINDENNFMINGEESPYLASTKPQTGNTRVDMIQ